jgi:hypothetical protein
VHAKFAWLMLHCLEKYQCLLRIFKLRRWADVRPSRQGKLKILANGWIQPHTNYIPFESPFNGLSSDIKLVGNHMHVWNMGCSQDAVALGQGTGNTFQAESWKQWMQIAQLIIPACAGRADEHNDIIEVSCCGCWSRAYCRVLESVATTEAGPGGCTATM